jgi:HNH endonuclease/AP2 domain
MEIQINGKHGAGKVLLIDNDGVALLQGKLVYMGGSSKHPGYMYPVITLNGRLMYVHKIIAESMGLSGEIDHINRDKCDARRQNLREATASQNQRNQGVRMDSTSKLKGVSWQKAAGKWQSLIQGNGRREHLGYFTCKFAAARAYDRRALELDPVYATTNLSMGLLPESPNFVPE